MLRPRPTVVLLTLLLSCGSSFTPIARAAIEPSTLAQIHPMNPMSQRILTLDAAVAEAIAHLESNAPLGLIQNEVSTEARGDNGYYVQLSLGRAYQQLGYAEEGLALLSAAITQLDPEFGALDRTYALLDQADLYQQLGQYENATAAASEALALATTHNDATLSAAATYELARIDLAQGNSAAAMLKLRQSAEQIGESSLAVRIWHDLSQAYAVQGQTAEATAAATEAQRLVEVWADAYAVDRTHLDPGQFLEPWEISLAEMKAAIATLESAIVAYEELEASWQVATTRAFLGRVYTQLGLYDRAQAQYEATLSLFSSTPPPELYAEVQAGLAQLAIARGDANAMATVQAARQGYQTLGNPQSEIDFLRQLGDQYRQNLDWPAAAETYLKLVEQFTVAGDESGRADAIATLQHEIAINLAYEGSDAQGQGDLDLAETFYRQALTLYELDPLAESAGLIGSGQVFTLNQLGRLYESQQRYAEAAALYEQAIALTQTLPLIDSSPSLEADTWMRLGWLQRLMGTCDPAGITSFETALTLYPADYWERSQAWGGLASCYEDLGQFELALVNQQRVVDFFRARSEASDEAQALNRLALIHTKQGDYDTAIAIYEATIAQQMTRDEPIYLAYSQIDVGQAYQAVGRYREAIVVTEAALAALQGKMGEEWAVAIALGNLGTLYTDLGQFERARDYQEQALALARELDDQVSIGYALNNLGGYYLDQADYDQALTVYEEALAIAQTIGDRTLEGIAAGNLGTVYHEQGQDETAIVYHQQQLMITEAMGDRRREAAARHNLGQSYLGLERLDEALEAHQEALTLAQDTRDRDLEAKILGSLGATLAAQGQIATAIATAIATYQAAVDRSQALLAEQADLDTSQKIAFLAQFDEIYQDYADLLRQNNQSDQGDLILQLLTPD